MFQDHHPVRTLVGEIISPTPHFEEDASLKADPLFSEEQLASWLATSIDSVRRMRERGDGPPFIRPTPKLIRYRRSDIDRWFERSKAVAA